MLTYFSKIGLFSLTLPPSLSISQPFARPWLSDLREKQPKRRKDKHTLLSLTWKFTFRSNRIAFLFFPKIPWWCSRAISHKVIYIYNKRHWCSAVQILWQCKWPPASHHFRRMTCMDHPVAAALRRLPGFIKHQCWKLLRLRILVLRKIDFSPHNRKAATTKLHLPGLHLSRFTTLHSTYETERGLLSHFLSWRVFTIRTYKLIEKPILRRKAAH